MTSPLDIANRILDANPNVPAPVTLEIYPTLRCNLDCQFCDTTDRHRPPQAELPPEEWVSIINEAARIGTKQIFVLGGGEPFIYPQLLDLLDTAKKNGMWGMLTTNGTFLNAERRKRLIEMQWDEIHISLDGATAKTHDTLRGKHGTFKKIINAVCHFRAESAEQKTPTIVFHWVITNRNFREIPAAIKLAKSLGVARVDFDSLIAYTPEQTELILNKGEQRAFRLLIQQGIKLSKRLGIQTTLTNHAQSNRGTTAPPSGPQSGILGAPCYKPWHHLTIQADGRTSPCCVLAGEGDSIRGSTLSEFWNTSPYLNRMRKSMLDHTPPKRCKECSPNILSQEWAIQREMTNIVSTKSISSKDSPTDISNKNT